MRKRLITPTPETVRPPGEGGLNLERTAAVEVTSEEENFPVESALVLGETRGWRAAIPGPMCVSEAHRLATILEERLPAELGMPAEVMTHLESLEDHADVHREQHYTGKPE